jgi:hypothetical protein
VTAIARKKVGYQLGYLGAFTSVIQLAWQLNAVRNTVYFHKVENIKWACKLLENSTSPNSMPRNSLIFKEIYSV